MVLVLWELCCYPELTRNIVRFQRRYYHWSPSWTCRAELRCNLSLFFLNDACIRKRGCNGAIDKPLPDYGTIAPGRRDRPEFDSAWRWVMNVTDDTSTNLQLCSSVTGLKWKGHSTSLCFLLCVYLKMPLFICKLFTQSSETVILLFQMFPRCSTETDFK